MYDGERYVQVRWPTEEDPLGNHLSRDGSRLPVSRQL